MTKTTEVTCSCGAVTLRLSGEPITQLYCHCDDCQRFHGAAYVPEVIYPLDAITVVRGDVTTWALKTTPRSRCRACGTPLFAKVPSFGISSVNGYLFPTGVFKPQCHINCRYALLPVRDDLPHFASLPAAFGGSDETVDW